MKKINTLLVIFFTFILFSCGSKDDKPEFSEQKVGEPPPEQQNKTTDGKGVFKETIPSTTVSGRVLIPKAHIEIALEFGALLPMDEKDEKLLTKAAQQRLAGTGFYQGEIDGDRKSVV